MAPTKTENILTKLEIYPQIKIVYPKNPNRMWAFPLLGGLVKIIILLPIFIEITLLTIFDIFVVAINSIVVLFSGKYWQFCFNFNLGLMRLIAKVTFFFAGLSDKYPGFDFKTTTFTLNLAMPKSPNRAFALPLLGGIVRLIFLIPFFIYTNIISNASKIGIVISSIPVLLSGKYPEGTFELTRDATRVSFAQLAYLVGIKDNYPSFYISMNHKTLKLILIAITIIFTLFQWSSSGVGGDEEYQKYDFSPYQNHPQ